jgi:hypothetical protein
MSDITTAFWGMVINNYDETDLALVRQGYPEHIRKITFTLEKGEKGTPHIQAFLRLFRQQRLSYVKKLFPGANFKALTSDEYKLNAEAYSTKQDDTAESPSVIINNPFPDPVVELTSVIEGAFAHFGDGTPFQHLSNTQFGVMVTMEQHARVREKPALAKFYVSATYRSIKKEYWRSIAAFIDDRKKSEEKVVDTHTHTHEDELFSHAEGITNDGETSSCCDDEGTEDEGEAEGSTEGEGEVDETDGGGSEGYCEEDDDARSGDEVCI